MSVFSSTLGWELYYPLSSLFQATHMQVIPVRISVLSFFLPFLPSLGEGVGADLRELTTAKVARYRQAPSSLPPCFISNREEIRLQYRSQATLG